VELCGPAVQDAKKNAELNGVKNSEFIESRAEAVMDSLLRQCYGSSGRLIAVVDPPRDGLHANCVRAIRACAPVKREFTS
jgi:tRNA (uracil-5-)-methyltransferase